MGERRIAPFKRRRLAKLTGSLAAPEPLKSRADTSSKEKEALAARIRELEASLKQNLTDAKAAVESRDAEIARLKAHIAELVTLRMKASQDEQRLHDWDHRFSSAVGEKDGEISRLRLELGTLIPLRDEVVTLNSQLHSAVAEKDAALERLHSQAGAVPASTVSGADCDDLKKIRGIGPVLEKRLNEYGVHWFRQIASWSQDDILAFERHLPAFQNRADRDRWVASARQEHLNKYGETL